MQTVKHLIYECFTKEKPRAKTFIFKCKTTVENAKVVDIVGPPAVGKSTVLQEMYKKGAINKLRLYNKT